MSDERRLPTIASDRIEVVVDPASGGRVAQLTTDGVGLLIDRASTADDSPGWGAYPMVPWAGRVRHGRFDFRGVTHQLPTNHGDHAMHGVGFVSPWAIADHDDRHIGLELELPSDDRWPFGGHVRYDITVGADDVLLSMTVTAGTVAFPVTFGWHPWFRRPSAVDFAPTAMYRRDHDHIAVDELVPVPPGPWDDCFVNHTPIGLTIDGVTTELTSDCHHWVVYDEPAHAICIEPQTGPPDAFNTGSPILEPGDSTAAWYRIRLVETAELG